VTVHKAGNFSIRCTRVPLPEVYSSITTVLHIAYVSKIESWSIEMALRFGEPEGGGVAVLPRSHNVSG